MFKDNLCFKDILNQEEEIKDRVEFEQKVVLVIEDLGNKEKDVFLLNVGIRKLRWRSFPIKKNKSENEKQS
jgi:hypothetical protein